MGRGPRSAVASWRPPDHVRSLHAADARAASNRPTRSTELWDEYKSAKRPRFRRGSIVEGEASLSREQGTPPSGTPLLIELQFY